MKTADCPAGRVSVHGGHSGSFCCHAADALEDMVAAYAEQGFSWVVISEHAPPADDSLRYPDEVAAGLSAGDLYRRFGAYMQACRRLQRQYAGRMRILVGFETEACGDYRGWTAHLVDTFRPDVVVGAVHHVDGIPFDFGPEEYRRAEAACGGTEALYCRYFDLQYEMIEALRPQVLAHLELIRIFDAHWAATLARPAVRRRIERNLQAAVRHGLVLDYNTAAWRKGAEQPWVSDDTVRTALALGAALAPGDDSHSVDTVGAGIDRAAARLCRMGARPPWPVPQAMENGEP